MQTIHQCFEHLQYGPRNTVEPLPEIPAANLGCVKHDSDFNLRAADLLLGADAGQMEELVRSMGTLCHNIGLESGDDAYSDAAVLLRHAADALHGRAGE